MQIFKIVVPYVILSAVFATLNARLRLPSFSLFLVALTLTDGGHNLNSPRLSISDCFYRNDHDIFFECD